jgi:hypothetical protein
MKQDIKISYHQNGSDGEAYHLVRFTDDDGYTMLGAVVFAEPGRVAIMNLRFPELGRAERREYEAEEYEAWLRQVIEAKGVTPEYYPGSPQNPFPKYFE